MWLIYSLGAAVLWGINYAASGRVLGRGVSAVTLYLMDLLFAVLAIGLGVVWSGRLKHVLPECRGLGQDWVWLVTAMICSTAAGLLVFLAIEQKNATLASFIEISYPLFVALFAWLFFRELQLTWPTAVGGGLILAGVGVIFWGNRH